MKGRIELIEKGKCYISHKILIVLLCIWGLFPKSASANHLYGGEINYRFLGASGGKEIYRVTLSLFADCSAQMSSMGFESLPGAGPSLDVYNGPIYSRRMTMSYDPENSDKEITTICVDDADKTACVYYTNPYPGIKVFQYYADVELEGRAPQWRFIFTGSITSSSMAGRSIAINNVSSGSVMMLEAVLNNEPGPNSSAAFSALPTPFFCLGKTSSYILGAVDPDGDVLSFKLIAPQKLGNAAGVLVDEEYIAPYNAQTPLPSSPSDYGFNSLSGRIDFKPNQVMNCLVVNKVEEYNNGVFVGSTMREMTFIIMPDCDAQAPEDKVVKVVNGEVDRSDERFFKVCQGRKDTFTLDIEAFTDDGDNISVTYTALPPGASISIEDNNTPAPRIFFEWPLEGASEGDYLFYITYLDDGCPLSYQKTQGYLVRVGPYDIDMNISLRGPCEGRQDGEIRVGIPGESAEMLQFVWEDEDGNILKDASFYGGDTLKGLQMGTYFVTVKHSNGCWKKSKVVLDSFLAIPEVNIVNNDTTLCEGMPLRIMAMSNDGEATYLWSNGEQGCCITVKEAATYTVSAENRCGATSDQLKIGYVHCDFCLFVPSAFSPNGDGKNDRLKVLETCPLKKYKISIFNRWGQLVYYSSDIGGGWDGMHNGTPAEIGVYLYQIEAVPENALKEIASMKGEIHLVR